MTPNSRRRVRHRQMVPRRHFVFPRSTHQVGHRQASSNDKSCLCFDRLRELLRTLNRFTCPGGTLFRTLLFPKTDPKQPHLRNCSTSVCPTAGLPHRAGYTPCNVGTRRSAVYLYGSNAYRAGSRLRTSRLPARRGRASATAAAGHTCHCSEPGLDYIQCRTVFARYSRKPGTRQRQLSSDRCSRWRMAAGRCIHRVCIRR